MASTRGYSVWRGGRWHRRRLDPVVDPRLLVYNIRVR
jgi:hypothetical protein